jgi:dUTP pyrophosphatase
METYGLGPFLQVGLVNCEIALLDGAGPPLYHSERAVGFDLMANEDAFIRPGRVAKVATGVILKPEPGYFAMVVARSSLQKRGLMLANGVGIVDPDYCGPTDQVFLPLHNFDEVTITVKRGERLAQVVILPHIRAIFGMFSPGGSDRGGFGSTGQ